MAGSEMPRHQGAGTGLAGQPAQSSIKFRHQLRTKPATLIRLAGKACQHIQGIAQHVVLVGTMKQAFYHPRQQLLLAVTQGGAMPTTQRHGTRVFAQLVHQGYQRHPGHRAPQGHIRRFTEGGGFKNQRVGIARQVHHHTDMTPGATGKDPDHLTGKTTTREQ